MNGSPSTVVDFGGDRDCTKPAAAGIGHGHLTRRVSAIREKWYALLSLELEYRLRVTLQFTHLTFAFAF